MAVSLDSAKYWIKKARDKGLPEEDILKVEMALRTGDHKPLGSLITKLTSMGGKRVQRPVDNSFERYPDGKPKGDLVTGTPAYNERIPLYTDMQRKYMDNALRFSGQKIPQLYDQLDQKSKGGLLTEMFGNNASKGFEDLIGQLGGSVGEYLPGLLSAGAGRAMTGGGIGDILQSLIGNAAAQYTQRNMGQSPMFNDMQSGIGNIYNRGISALGGLFGNRG